MLAKIAPRFVIGGVIQNAYYANYMAIELTKHIIGDSAQNFALHDPKHYYECNFYGYLSTLPRPTEFANQFEAEKYDEAVQKFVVYNEVRTIYNILDQYTNELKELYRVAEKDSSSANFFSRAKQSDEVWEEDVKKSLEKYNILLKNLEAYPEWRAKVIEEVGKWFHMIHNTLDECETKRELFQKLDRQEYFV